MPSDSFVHLHLHTEYSTLDGAVRIKDLMTKVKRCKMPAVAMTDHGNLFGAIDFYKEARKADIKPIIGCEMYLAPGSMHEKKPIAGRKNASHLTLLTRNAAGYENLVKLVSKAHLDGMYRKPRIDKEQLDAHSEGIICLSGCINGEINQMIQAGQLDLARKSLEEFVDIYGKDDFYLEMHDHGLEQQHLCNRQLIEFSKEYGLKLVAANDVHFLGRKDHEAHDVMICIGTGKLQLDENRMRYSPEVYFKTTREMQQLFKETPEAISNTLEIAEKCEFEMQLDATSSERYPKYDSPEPGLSREKFFEKLCWEGLEWRYDKERAETDTELRKRLEYEMGIMEKMGFVSYFLITWDFIKWARDNDIPVGPGRGSAAGSLVAYCMGITDLDPIRFGLIFERFLNPERVSPPDVDVDFCQSRRPEVIEYVRHKYGERCVSHIITFGTLGAKSVVRDVGRVLGWSYGDADRIAKMIPTELGITLSSARSKNPELKEALQNEEATQQLWRYATFLEGLTRGVGIHAAGVVIGDCDLDEHVPLTRGNEGEVVTQYAMKPLTELGMLKMDFLGLKTLTVIQDAVNLIREHTPDFDLGDIPLDDQKTFDLLNAGETVGVFQLESSGMMSLCRQFGVDRIEDIIALIALYRPGPMDLIPDFISRKKGRTPVSYLHPLLEDVSKETHGILIYQEQVQKAANLLAGYSLGDADLLRRAMGKKDPKEMAKQREVFVQGAKRENNIPEKKANAIFDLLEKFAGYGFNKSHSAAYGLISYQTAYLKANYPVEFMAGLLSNEINNTDKISVFVNECQRMGYRILPPDVNRSQLKFSPERDGDADTDKANAVRFGLAAIKNVGAAAMASAIAERATNGEFASVDDFARRVDTKSVNRKILEALIRCGAFDFSGEDRAAQFARQDQIIAAASSAQRDRASGQGSLFDDDTLAGAAAPPPVASGGEAVEPWTTEEILQAEKDLLGFYVTGHPLDPYRDTLAAGEYVELGLLDEMKEGKRLLFAGSITGVDIRYTKRGGKPFAIMTIEDFTGQTEVMVWNETYTTCKDALQKGAVVELRAKVELDSRSDSKRLTAEKVRALTINADAPAAPQPDLAPQPGPDPGPAPKAEPEPDEPPVRNVAPPARGEQSAPSAPRGPLVLTLDASRDSEEDLYQIHDIVKANAGPTPLEIHITAEDGAILELAAGSEFGVAISDALLQELAAWIEDDVTLAS